MSVKRPKVVNEYESLWVKPHQIDEKRWERDAVSWPARAAQTHGGRHQDVSTKAAQGDMMALALLREIEDDTRIAAKISEGPSPLQTPELSKLTHFALRAFTQLAYASGSHELRAMASWMPFDLSYLTRALSTLMSLAHKALGTRTSIDDLLKVCVTEGPGQSGAENKPNPFANIVEANWTGFKLDVIADSSLIFTVGPETQGVTRDEKGKLKAPAG